MKSQAGGKQLVHIAANSIGESTMKLLEESLQNKLNKIPASIQINFFSDADCLCEFCDA